MNNELLAVVEYLERERGLDRETLIRAIEDALLTAARKGIRDADDLKVVVDRKTYEIKAIAQYKVVDVVQNPALEKSVADARRIRFDARAGETVSMEVTPRDFGRIAAQTARQAMMQRLRQAERDRIFQEFKGRAGDIISGTVRRFEGRDVVLELGRAEALMPSQERLPTEDYNIGDRIRALVVKVQNNAAGPEIIVSRASPDFIRRLFELEVAEVADGTVEIRALAREPGYRTKIAVSSRDEKVDPVGACVGLRGMRTRNITRELSGEKMDVCHYREDIRQYVAEALKPAKLQKITLDEATRTVNIQVAADNLSLAIGKKGQNARLTAKLVGWRVDIDRDSSEVSFEEKVRLAIESLAKISAIGQENAERLVQAGFLSLEGVVAADMEDLRQVEGFDEATASKIKIAAERAYESLHGPVE